MLLKARVTVTQCWVGRGRTWPLGGERWGWPPAGLEDDRWPGVGWKMTAGWGEGWIWPPAGVEDDRWAEGGEYNRQQVWRMTAGRKGESLTASSVKAYRETSFKSWNLWRVTWNVDDAVKNDKRTPRWPVTRRLNSMTRWRVTHRQKYDACPALLLLYKNIGVRKKNSLLILNLDIQSELSATPIHQSQRKWFIQTGGTECGSARSWCAADRSSGMTDTGNAWSGATYATVCLRSVWCTPKWQACLFSSNSSYDKL